MSGMRSGWCENVGPLESLCLIFSIGFFCLLSDRAAGSVPNGRRETNKPELLLASKQIVVRATDVEPRAHHGRRVATSRPRATPSPAHQALLTHVGSGPRLKPCPTRATSTLDTHTKIGHAHGDFPALLPNYVTTVRENPQWLGLKSRTRATTTDRHQPSSCRVHNGTTAHEIACTQPLPHTHTHTPTLTPTHTRTAHRRAHRHTRTHRHAHTSTHTTHHGSR
jgi:hypothetical protein